MDADRLYTTILVVYIAVVAGYAGYRFGRRTLEREQELGRLRDRIFQLEYPGSPAPSSGGVRVAMPRRGKK